MQAQSQSTLEAQGLQWAPFLRGVMFLEITEGTRPSHRFAFSRKNTVLECVTDALSLSLRMTLVGRHPHPIGWR